MRTELIKSHIDQLHSTFGRPRSPICTKKLFEMYEKKDYFAMVRHIQDVLHLDLNVRLLLVNSGGPDAPAWVVAPFDMSLYGTRSFRETRVSIYIRKSFLNEVRFDNLVMAISHELCHIVLYSVKHPLQYSEEAVDLVSMLLGFREIYMTGCEVLVTEKPRWYMALFSSPEFKLKTYGYLTRHEIAFASQYMTELK